MGAGPQLLPQVVGDAAQIRSGGHPGAKADRLTIQRENLEFLDLHRHWLERYRLLLAGQLVGGHTGDFFGGKWWWNLSDLPHEAFRCLAEVFQLQIDALR